MDIKVAKVAKSTRPAPRGRRRRRIISHRWIFGMRSNTYVLRTAADMPALTSGTSGIIATTMSPSFSQVSGFSEYTPASSLFTNVRLLKACLEVIPINGLDTSTIKVGTKVVIGWQPAANFSNAAAPASFVGVQNLAFYTDVLSSSNRIAYCNVTQSNALPNTISAAAPTPDTGDCGSFYIFGSGFTNSLGYWSVILHALFELSGRI